MLAASGCILGMSDLADGLILCLVYILFISNLIVHIWGLVVWISGLALILGHSILGVCKRLAEWS